MGKIAFVFPGQGSQTVGMGQDLYRNFEGAREVFDQADALMNGKITEVCFHGPEAVLKDTRNAQPAILTASIAAYQVLKAEGIKPDFVAGHSLGEYSALVAAEAVGFGDALRLVRERSHLMAEADPEGTGAMAAVLGLDPEAFAECLNEASESELVEAANYNCPGQVVVSGTSEGVAKMQELVTAGGGKFIPLAVSGPFHSSLMKDAADRFAPILETVTWCPPLMPVICNVTARPVTKELVRDHLYRQIFSSVLWEDSLNYLAQAGVNIFVEVGPGKVLSGLTKKTVKGAAILHCEDSESIKKALAILKEV